MNLILKLFSFKTISDTCFSWLFRITVLDDYFGCLFQMPISDDFSRWLSDASEWPFQITVPDEYFGSCFKWLFKWLFVIPRLIRILVTNPYFHGLFQPITHFYSNLSFDWLVLRLIRFWTTASYCRIMAPIPLIFTWDEHFSSLCSNRGEISALFAVMKFLHIIIILFLYCCRLAWELKSYHHGLTAWNFTTGWNCPPLIHP